MCSFRFSLSVKLLTQNGQLSIFLLDLTLGGDGSFGCSSFFPTLSKTPSSAIMVWLRSSAAAAGPISIFCMLLNLIPHKSSASFFMILKPLTPSAFTVFFMSTTRPSLVICSCSTFWIIRWLLYTEAS